MITVLTSFGFDFIEIIIRGCNISIRLKKTIAGTLNLTIQIAD